MLNALEGVGGAARAAARLERGLRERGLDARLLVHFRSVREGGALCRGGALRRAARRLKVYLGVLPVRAYPNRPENNFTPALLPDGLPREVRRAAPDLIHLHWLGAGFCRIETLAKFSQPLVWTLHDSWAFTGGCHVPFACDRYRQRCGACPVLGSRREADLSRWTWRRKERAWRDLNLTIVAPSCWLAECVRSSSLLGHFPVRVIPNGLDVERFRPMDRSTARNLLGLPEDRKIVLFGAVNATSDANKGWRLLHQALKVLASDVSGVEAVVFGAPRPNVLPDVGMPLHFLGELNEEAKLVAAYASADVFVLPSLSEVFPLVGLEALATGTPVVAFNIGGLPDLIEHQRDGYLARPYELADLARGIAWFLEDPERRAEAGRRAREKAVGKFSLGAVAERYIALYGEVLAPGAGGRSG